jgi:hypothetical protein
VTERAAREVVTVDRASDARFLEGDVKCFACGQTVGVLQRALVPHRTPAIFRNGSGGPSRRVVRLADLRCARCRGSIYIDEYRVCEPEPVFDAAAERPRRGRAPSRMAG